jgi:hypothetical protein
MMFSKLLIYVVYTNYKIIDKKIIKEKEPK